MSELQNNREFHRSFRQQVLAGVSAASLFAALHGLQSAQADESDRSTVWIELGGQLERVDGGSQRFSPSFEPMIADLGLTTPSQVSREARYSNGAEGKISVQPSGSDWKFSAALRYGRSNRAQTLHQETNGLASADSIASIPLFGIYASAPVPALAKQNASTAIHHDESHLVLDFQAGRDVGLGVFGKSTASVISAGVRFAQFASRSASQVNALGGFAFSYKYITQFYGYPAYVKQPRQSWNLYQAQASASRSFQGLGPSVQWEASTPIMGNANSAELALDWGINAAVLFGRQKARAHHETKSFHQTSATSVVTAMNSSQVHNASRSRFVVIPNVGGFAGFSFKFPNAKISLGYRADFFFGVMDGGIDTRKTYDRNFYGPFATISVGLGG